jgi:predicted nucleic acid-binding protein
MAQQALAIDASVGVKWFSAEGEAYVAQARSILKAQASGDIKLVVPDLFFHEIANALTCKKTIPISLVEDSLALLFSLGLSVYSPGEAFYRSTVRLARKHNITEYDACYVSVALGSRCPLVTADPHHQKKDFGCSIIAIEDWKLPL